MEVPGPALSVPFIRCSQPGQTHAIDPAVAFGRPVVASKGVTTAVIAERIDAGETETDQADDYDPRPESIRQAILYERAA